MDLRNCPECGRVFTYVRTYLCPACQQADEENFKKVRQFIGKNPGAGIIEVSAETEVDENKIIRYLREGKLSVAALNSKIRLECEVCGKLITTGRFCKECTEKLTAGLKKSIENENRKVLEEMKEHNGPRMHTDDIRRK